MPTTNSWLLTGARLATMQTGNAYGLIDKGCLAVDNNQITWIGDSSDLPRTSPNAKPSTLKAASSLLP